MFNRFAAVLHQAVEAIAPTQTLLEDFVFHWKAITHYFINNKDDKQPVQDSNIPNHLDNMLVILTQEEGQMEANQTGPCMEHLLQHKILETLWTLGKADCPPGMKQMVLMFFTNLLGRIKQPLLPHINVYKPVHRLVKVCGETRAGPTEKEEIQFLCVVCFKLREDPYLVNFFLEDPRQSSIPRQSSSRQRSSHKTKPDPSQAEFSVVDSLLKLVQSPDSRIAVKACEGLMLCASLPESHAAQCMVKNTQFCTLLAERLCSLYNALPLSMDPVDIESVEAKWGLDVLSDSDDTNNFPGKRQLISLLSWFDYCDQIIKEGNPIIGKALSTQVKENFLVPIIEQLLLQTSEVGILTSTAHLAKFVKMTSSPHLLNEFVHFILGDNASPEKPGETDHKIRHRLIERCDHLSDEICIMSLKLFEVLLQKSHIHIVNNLVLRNLQTRSYLDRRPPPSPSSPSSPPVSPTSPSQSPSSPGSHPEVDLGEAAVGTVSVDSDFPLTNGPTSIGAGDQENHIPDDPLLQGIGTPPASDQEPDATATDSLSDNSLGIDSPLSSLTNSVPQPSSPTSLLPPVSDTPNTNSALSLTAPLNGAGATPSLVAAVPVLTTPAPPQGVPMLMSPAQSSTQAPVALSPISQLLSSPPDLLSSTTMLGTSPSLSLTSPRSLGSPPVTPGSPTSHGEGEADPDHDMHRVVSCFLGLIPEENKSSYLTGDTGYDMYLREAHRNFRECTVNSLPYDWPNYPKPLDRCPESEPFYEGAFIKILFDKLSRMLDQTYEVNLQVTSVLAKIALYPHPHIHEYLLDPFLPIAPGCRNLHSVLEKVVSDLSVRVKSIPEFQKQLFLVRQQLMGIVEEQDSLPYIDLLEGVIVLEEFCKELAAVAFVKYHAASGR